MLENVQAEKKGGEWPLAFTRKFFQSNEYTLTDAAFNDLSLLFTVPIKTFFSAEDFPHNILYLKRKDTRRLFLFTSQTLSFQSEMMQKDGTNENEEDEDALLQSKGGLTRLERAQEEKARQPGIR